ncbi:MotA/TolQ/ExbB proton channel family protein [Luteolibacter marinus]|uniref:MotA/TolQ/ExbB proton channel family protein n=1 Tax=Luteolibacter marinus TaxID=2776705 RepID=UPI001D030704|nr:MotA/TolQ/ExbB proton channel family protein [Luteolibacter marinus]
MKRGWMIALLVAALPVHAETTVPEALDQAKKDLASSLAKLEETRSAITAEKPGLTKEFEEIELDLREKRRLVRIARMSKDDREQQLRELQRDQLVRRQDVSYLAGLLKDHALKIETLRGPGEPPIAVEEKVIAAEADEPAKALEDRLQIVDASLDRLEMLFGGSKQPGKASTAGGEVVEGEFAAAGPLAWFSGGQAAGAVVWEKGASLPKVHEGNADAIRALVAGNEAVAGLDVTGGKARALEEVGGGFTDLVRKGGLWVWPIILLALLSLVFGLIKLARFAGFREPGEAWVNAILAAMRTGDRAKAEQLAVQMKHPAGPVMGKLVDVSGNSADVVEETLYEQLMGVQQKVGSMLPVIAVTAATAPLLGLLGTVSGMIRTFNLITVFGSGDPKPLAGGISEALVTTLFGLVVAIPALILHAFLSRRSQGIVQTTERLGLSFVNALRGK